MAKLDAVLLKSIPAVINVGDTHSLKIEEFKRHWFVL